MREGIEVETRRCECGRALAARNRCGVCFRCTRTTERGRRLADERRAYRKCSRCKAVIGQANRSGLCVRCQVRGRCATCREPLPAGVKTRCAACKETLARCRPSGDQRGKLYRVPHIAARMEVYRERARQGLPLFTGVTP